MEREDNSSELLELGTASTETLGTPIVARPEDNGYFLGLGLSDE
ncbi:MAG: benenodin family lasso peptide [Sphingomonas sp.]|nr:benenodin family lasso peptide [Sphingomonas sp.]